MCDMVDDEQLPFELNVKHHGQFVEIEKDRLTVKYSGQGNHANDVGSVQANLPLPTTKLIYYFEVTILDAGRRGTIAIGLSKSTFDLKRQPGWEVDSYGYHGDDGRKYQDSGRGEPYAVSYTTDDVVGCGVHFENQEIFYTKNGKYLGVAFKKVTGTLYPTIGLHSVGERVAINFGQDYFKFDVHAMVQEEREKKLRAVARVPVEVGDVNKVIRQYLLYCGYRDTLQAFDRTCGNDDDVAEADDYQLSDRKVVQQMILSGKVGGECFDFIQKTFDGLLAKTPRVAFQLHCQNFIEMIVKGKPEEAMLVAQTNLSMYRDLFGEEESKHLNNVVALLAYENPLESPVKFLLGSEQREAVADVVNKAILRHYKVEEPAVLMQLSSQLGATLSTLRTESGSGGELFDVNQYV